MKIVKKYKYRIKRRINMKKILLILSVLMFTFSCGSKEKTEGVSGDASKASGNEKIKIEIISKGY